MLIFSPADEAASVTRAVAGEFSEVAQLRMNIMKQFSFKEFYNNNKMNL